MNEAQAIAGLHPKYQAYKQQKCFIAYTQQAAWADDLLSVCREILSRPEFNLEPDFARKHFDPNITLREKALELIANARYGIYDLSYLQDDKGEWHMPRNVFVELGMAIALNRPTLLLRHACNRKLELPECLNSICGHILEFSGETTLKKALQKHLPQWVNAPPDQDWWNRYCIFGDQICEYRETHPRAKQWEQKALPCYISDGPDVDRDDFRGVVGEVLGRFSGVTFDYLDAIPADKDCGFLLCNYCQTVRSTPFAIDRITPRTQGETFITIGMSIALESQFEYKIPKILFVEDVHNVPSLLSGYEVVVARNDRERKSHLRTFMPTVIQKARETAWKPRPLPFVEKSVASSKRGLPRVPPESGLHIDESGHVWVDGQPVVPALSQLEFRLLKALYRQSPMIVSREELIKTIWPTSARLSDDEDVSVDEQNLRKLVARLRKRLPSERSRFIKNVRGRGYWLEIQ